MTQPCLLDLKSHTEFTKSSNIILVRVALRKLSKKSSNVEGKLQRENIIQQYTNFDSQVYAPMTRIGVYLDSGSEQYSVKNWFTTTLDGKYHSYSLQVELKKNL